MVFSIVSEQALWADFQRSGAAGVAPAVTGRVLAQKPWLIQPPAEHASLEEFHVGTNGKLIVHLQDPHANFGGQENLAQALGALSRTHDLSLVLSEGGEGDSSLGDLRGLLPRKTWQRVARRWLREAKISGEEYWNLTSDRPLTVEGLEEVAPYLDGVDAYGDLAEKREASLAYLQKIKRVVRVLKSRLYPADLLAYEKHGQDLNGKLDGLSAWLSSSGGAKEKHLSQLLELRALEKANDLTAVNLEHAALLEKMGDRGRERAAEWTHRGTADALRQPALLLSYFQKTLDIARQIPVDLTAYPELSNYVVHLQRFSELDLEAALDEMASAEKRMFDETLTGREARVLRAIDRYTDLLESAFSIRMTSGEFAEFEANEKNFLTFASLSFLNRQAAENGLFDDLVGYEPILEEGKERLRRFYGSVDARDALFLKSAERAMTARAQDNAFLVAGGYHTEHLKKLFVEKGYSFAVLRPVVTQETNLRQYEERLLAPLKKRPAAGVESAVHIDVSRKNIRGALLPLLKKVDPVSWKDMMDEVVAERPAAARLADISSRASSPTAKSQASSGKTMTEDFLARIAEETDRTVLHLLKMTMEHKPFRIPWNQILFTAGQISIHAGWPMGLIFIYRVNRAFHEAALTLASWAAPFAEDAELDDARVAIAARERLKQLERSGARLAGDVPREKRDPINVQKMIADRSPLYFSLLGDKNISDAVKRILLGTSVYLTIFGVKPASRIEVIEFQKRGIFPDQSSLGRLQTLLSQAGIRMEWNEKFILFYGLAAAEEQIAHAQTYFEPLVQAGLLSEEAFGDFLDKVQGKRSSEILSVDEIQSALLEGVVFGYPLEEVVAQSLLSNSEFIGVATSIQNKFIEKAGVPFSFDSFYLYRDVVADLLKRDSVYPQLKTIFTPTELLFLKLKADKTVAAIASPFDDHVSTTRVEWISRQAFNGSARYSEYYAFLGEFSVSAPAMIQRYPAAVNFLNRAGVQANDIYRARISQEIGRQPSGSQQTGLKTIFERADKQIGSGARLARKPTSEASSDLALRDARKIRKIIIERGDLRVSGTNRLVLIYFDVNDAPIGVYLSHERHSVPEPYAYVAGLFSSDDLMKFRGAQYFRAQTTRKDIHRDTPVRIQRALQMLQKLPQVEDLYADPAYAAAYADQWDAETPEQVRASRARLMSMLPPTGIVLDAGSASGRDTAWFQTQHRKALGIDKSEAMVAEARRRHPGVKFQASDMQSLHSVSGGSVAGVYANTSMFHMNSSDATRAFGEFYRVLTGEGVLFARVRRGIGQREDADGRLIYFYEEKNLRETLERIGFQIVEMTATQEPDRPGVDWLEVYAIKPNGEILASDWNARLRSLTRDEVSNLFYRILSWFPVNRIVANRLLARGPYAIRLWVHKQRLEHWTSTHSAEAYHNLVDQLASDPLLASRTTGDNLTDVSAQWLSNATTFFFPLHGRTIVIDKETYRLRVRPGQANGTWQIGLHYLRGSGRLPSWVTRILMNLVPTRLGWMWPPVGVMTVRFDAGSSSALEIRETALSPKHVHAQRPFYFHLLTEFIGRNAGQRLLSVELRGHRTSLEQLYDRIVEAVNAELTPEVAETDVLRNAGLIEPSFILDAIEGRDSWMPDGPRTLVPAGGKSFSVRFHRAGERVSMKDISAWIRWASEAPSPEVAADQRRLRVHEAAAEAFRVGFPLIDEFQSFLKAGLEPDQIRLTFRGESIWLEETSPPRAIWAETVRKKKLKADLEEKVVRGIQARWPVERYKPFVATQIDEEQMGFDAFEDGEWAGSIGFTYHAASRTLHSFKLRLRPQVIGRGIGNFFVRELIGHFPDAEKLVIHRPADSAEPFADSLQRTGLVANLHKRIWGDMLVMDIVRAPQSGPGQTTAEGARLAQISAENLEVLFGPQETLETFRLLLNSIGRFDPNAVLERAAPTSDVFALPFELTPEGKLFLWQLSNAALYEEQIVDPKHSMEDKGFHKKFIHGDAYLLAHKKPGLPALPAAIVVQTEHDPIALEVTQLFLPATATQNDFQAAKRTAWQMTTFFVGEKWREGPPKVSLHLQRDIRLQDGWHPAYADPKVASGDRSAATNLSLLDIYFTDEEGGAVEAVFSPMGRFSQDWQILLKRLHEGSAGSGQKNLFTGKKIGVIGTGSGVDVLILSGFGAESVHGTEMQLSHKILTDLNAQFAKDTREAGMTAPIFTEHKRGLPKRQDLDFILFNAPSVTDFGKDAGRERRFLERMVTSGRSSYSMSGTDLRDFLGDLSGYLDGHPSTEVLMRLEVHEGWSWRSAWSAFLSHFNKPGPKKRGLDMLMRIKKILEDYPQLKATHVSNTIFALSSPGRPSSFAPEQPSIYTQFLHSKNPAESGRLAALILSAPTQAVKPASDSEKIKTTAAGARLAEQQGGRTTSVIRAVTQAVSSAAQGIASPFATILRGLGSLLNLGAEPIASSLWDSDHWILDRITGLRGIESLPPDYMKALNSLFRHVHPEDLSGLEITFHPFWSFYSMKSLFFHGSAIIHRSEGRYDIVISSRGKIFGEDVMHVLIREALFKMDPDRFERFMRDVRIYNPSARSSNTVYYLTQVALRKIYDPQKYEKQTTAYRRQIFEKDIFSEIFPNTDLSDTVRAFREAKDASRFHIVWGVAVGTLLYVGIFSHLPFLMAPAIAHLVAWTLSKAHGTFAQKIVRGVRVAVVWTTILTVSLTSAVYFLSMIYGRPAGSRENASAPPPSPIEMVLEWFKPSKPRILPPNARVVSLTLNLPEKKSNPFKEPQKKKNDPKKVQDFVYEIGYEKEVPTGNHWIYFWRGQLMLKGGYAMYRNPILEVKESDRVIRGSAFIRLSAPEAVPDEQDAEAVEWQKGRDVAIIYEVRPPADMKKVPADGIVGKAVAKVMSGMNYPTYQSQPFALTTGRHQVIIPAHRLTMDGDGEIVIDILPIQAVPTEKEYDRPAPSAPLLHIEGVEYRRPGEGTPQAPPPLVGSGSKPDGARLAEISAGKVKALFGDHETTATFRLLLNAVGRFDSSSTLENYAQAPGVTALPFELTADGKTFFWQLANGELRRKKVVDLTSMHDAEFPKTFIHSKAYVVAEKKSGSPARPIAILVQTSEGTISLDLSFFFLPASAPFDQAAAIHQSGRKALGDFLKTVLGRGAPVADLALVRHLRTATGWIPSYADPAMPAYERVSPLNMTLLDVLAIQEDGSFSEAIFSPSNSFSVDWQRLLSAFHAGQTEAYVQDIFKGKKVGVIGSGSGVEAAMLVGFGAAAIDATDMFYMYKVISDLNIQFIKDSGLTKKDTPVRVSLKKGIPDRNDLDILLFNTPAVGDFGGNAKYQRRYLEGQTTRNASIVIPLDAFEEVVAEMADYLKVHPKTQILLRAEIDDLRVRSRLISRVREAVGFPVADYWKIAENSERLKRVLARHPQIQATHVTGYIYAFSTPGNPSIFASEKLSVLTRHLRASDSAQLKELNKEIDKVSREHEHRKRFMAAMGGFVGGARLSQAQAYYMLGELYKDLSPREPLLFEMDRVGIAYELKGWVSRQSRRRSFHSQAEDLAADLHLQVVEEIRSKSLSGALTLTAGKVPNSLLVRTLRHLNAERIAKYRNLNRDHVRLALASLDNLISSISESSEDYEVLMRGPQSQIHLELPSFIDLQLSKAGDLGVAAVILKPSHGSPPAFSPMLDDPQFIDFLRDALMQAIDNQTTVASLGMVPGSLFFVQAYRDKIAELTTISGIAELDYNRLFEWLKNLEKENHVDYLIAMRMLSRAAGVTIPSGAAFGWRDIFNIKEQLVGLSVESKLVDAITALSHQNADEERLLSDLRAAMTSGARLAEVLDREQRLSLLTQTDDTVSLAQVDPFLFAMSRILVEVMTSADSAAEKELKYRAIIGQIAQKIRMNEPALTENPLGNLLYLYQNTGGSYSSHWHPTTVTHESVLMGIGLYMIHNSLRRGYAEPDLAHVERLIAAYNADSEVLVPFDVPSLMAQSVAIIFPNDDFFYRISEQSLKLPERYRGWLVAIMLFLEGAHRLPNTPDFSVDYRLYPGKLKVMAERLEATPAISDGERQALLMGFAKFWSVLNPMMRRHVEITVIDGLAEDTRKEISRLSRLQEKHLIGDLQLRKAAYGKIKPAEALERMAARRINVFEEDPYLLGLSALIFVQGKSDVFNKNQGRVSFTLTQLLFDRSNPEINRYLSAAITDLRQRNVRLSIQQEGGRPVMPDIYYDFEPLKASWKVLEKILNGTRLAQEVSVPANRIYDALPSADVWTPEDIDRLEQNDVFIVARAWTENQKLFENELVPFEIANKNLGIRIQEAPDDRQAAIMTFHALENGVWAPIGKIRLAADYVARAKAANAERKRDLGDVQMKKKLSADLDQTKPALAAFGNAETLFRQASRAWAGGQDVVVKIAIDHDGWNSVLAAAVLAQVRRAKEMLKARGDENAYVQFVSMDGSTVYADLSDSIEHLAKGRFSEIYVSPASEAIVLTAQKAEAGLLSVENPVIEGNASEWNAVPYAAAVIGAVLLGRADNRASNEKLDQLLANLIGVNYSASDDRDAAFADLRRVTIADAKRYLSLSIRAIAKLGLDRILEFTRLILHAVGTAA